MSRLELSLAFQTDKPPAVYAELGALVHRFGFDVVSVYNDLFYQPALGPLLLLAQHVQRARLGPAALNPFTLHPVEIAGQVALLDAVSGGRAYLGLVRGSWLEAIGLQAEQPIRRLQEAILLVRYLLAGRTDGWCGQLFHIAPGVRLQYAVRRPEVPIMLGTWGERTARQLGPLVDEVKIGGSTNPAMVQRMRGWLPLATGVCAGAVTVVDQDGAEARARARREVAMYLAVVAALDVTLDDPDWLARIRACGNDYAAISRSISDAQLERFAFAGTPEDIVGQVRALRAAGASRVEFGTPHGLQPDSGIRLLGEQVLPRLRADA